MSSTGTTTCRSKTFAVGGGPRRRPPRPAEPRGHLLRRPDRRRQADPLSRRVSSASSRSRLSARCAPRLVPAIACTSSTMTVSMPRSASRACEVSSRNSDSGVVIRMSGGLVPAAPLLRGGVPGAHRDADVRLGQPQPTRRLPHPGERGSQVALDVHRQRLEWRHVQHPASPLRILRRGSVSEPVDRPQERR